MKLCNDCKNLGKKTQCKYYGIGSNHAERCKDYEEPKQTNADRIRAMSDEELAEVIDGTIPPCTRCVNKERYCSTTKYCRDGILEWLKSEAKEET